MSDSSEHHLSKDGSSTLYSNQFGQYYHNPNGAISESKHVFFDVSGLMQALNSEKNLLTIFEVGFGTGLNFLLLIDHYLTNNLTYPVHFYSVEAFPISKKLSAQFNFSEFLECKELKSILPDIFGDLKPGKNSFQPFPDKDIHLHLYLGLFDEIEDIEHPVNFIFQDAFSPEVNEELWSVNTFERLASFCKHDAVMATYCAASNARAAMAKAKWLIGRAPGALGKREMTLASLSKDKLSRFKRVNERRLIERFDKGEFS